ncbi:MAG: hypothetical protein PVF34_07170 [Gammaproteobacteria bacterium]
MQNRWLLLACVVVVATGIPVVGYTDTLVIPDIAEQPTPSRNNVARPARAMTMEQVRAEFGEPLKILGPVGDPPITRWIYDKMTVHFEREYVIHSTINKNR